MLLFMDLSHSDSQNPREIFFYIQLIIFGEILQNLAHSLEILGTRSRKTKNEASIETINFLTFSLPVTHLQPVNVMTCDAGLC